MTDDDPESKKITDRLARARKRREELPDEVDELKTRVDHLTHQAARVEAMGEGISRAMNNRKEEAEEKKPIRPWHWPDLEHEDAGTKADELAKWILDVLSRYPADYRTLLGCWEQHPACWDVLEACWLTWLMAFRHPERTPAMAAEWHAVHRPNLHTQLEELLRPCRGGKHDPKSILTVA